MISTSLLPDTVYYIISAVLVLGVLLGIYLMSKVEKAYSGNTISAVSMALAIILTMFQYNVFGADVRTGLIVVIAAMLVGSAIGAWIATKVKMIQMPQTVALLNGFGGGASAFVAALTLLTVKEASGFALCTGMLALVVGIVTLVGSLVAAAKLQGIMKSKPVILPGHSPLTMISLFGSLALCVLIIFFADSAMIPLVIIGLVLSCAFGLLFSIRVGGADMPITISLLNSFSGVAGSIAGLAIGDVLLVAVGGIVGASGLILTQIMCKAMNRSLMDILLGKTAAPAKKSEPKAEAPAEEKKEEPKEEKKNDVGTILREAKEVIIVPGYGMALAQAQANVKQLADKLTANGANVRYAIHPVAGRMPGHMNVLLAEVDVDYDQLYEMKAIDDDFKNADLAIVVGANDVTNPAAKEAEGTPIYGMPVLSVADTKNVIICNFDLKPGYAGVENPLYTREDVEILLGDAKESIMKLMTAMDSDDSAPAADDAKGEVDLGAIMKAAKDVIIVPGYGMALAQAQANVKQLADKLEANGANVRYAIHPVAGRMPGHMNVLLAEVDVDYDKLYEMKAIDDDFKNADLAIVVGANDVTNPAAKEAEGTPIYGMPVLSVVDAKYVIICNYDLKPGYAGVENPLYTKEEGVSILLGDAKESILKLMGLI